MSRIMKRFGLGVSATVAAAACSFAASAPAHAGTEQTFNTTGDWQVVGSAFNLLWPTYWEVDLYDPKYPAATVTSTSTIDLKTAVPPFIVRRDFHDHVAINAAPSVNSHIVLRSPKGLKARVVHAGIFA
ncbi:hypothetical protein [Streptomyces sp. NPDC060027]|uniref:hypothetical protein n=1 Tax=Streptomyces sp. NPDC060027 TaxID=3347040 RepID=UPI0036887C07